MAKKLTQAQEREERRNQKIAEYIVTLQEEGVQFDTDESDYVNRQLEGADALSDEKENLYKRIAANRDLLRNILRTGGCSEAQAFDILRTYPPVERGASEEEATAEAVAA